MLLLERVFWYYLQACSLCKNTNTHTQAHLQSLLSWLIWSVTKLCSRKETSAELTAFRLISLEEASSRTQWAKAKVKCRSVRMSVWACCEKKPGIFHRFRSGSIPTQKLDTLWRGLHLHQRVHRELRRVKSQTAVWSRICGDAAAIPLTQGRTQEPGGVWNKGNNKTKINRIALRNLLQYEEIVLLWQVQPVGQRRGWVLW